MSNFLRNRSVLSLIVFFSLIGLMNSCKEDEKIFMSLNSSEKTIYLGESFQFNCSLTSVGGASTDGLSTEWSVSDPSIISVDESGKVKALEVGMAILTAKLSNGDYATTQITVEKPSSMIFPEGEHVYYIPNSLKDTVRLSVNLSELDVEAGLNVEVEDPEIAVVDTFTNLDSEDVYMIVRTLEPGDTRIFVSNGDLKTYCEVHSGPVVKMGWDESLQTSANSMKVFKQDEPFQIVLYTQVTPQDANNYWQLEDLYEYRIEQSNESSPAALIENFDQSVRGQISWTVTPKELGTTKFYVSSRGQEVSLVLKVADKDKISVNSVSIEYNGTSVGYGSNDSTYVGTVETSSGSLLAFIAKTDPQNAASTWPVYWSSKDPSIAYYDESLGGISVLKDGETEVYASVPMTNDTLVAACRIVVKTEVTAISINTDSRNVIMVGDKEQLSFRTTPENLSPAVTWTSSDTSVATVDENGVVHGVSAGRVEITVSAGNVTSEPRIIDIVEPIADYNYEGAMYLYTYSGGVLTLEAQAADDNKSSVLTAEMSTLDNGTYTLGENMTNVKFVYDGVTAVVTSGTITVSGDSVKKFNINLNIELADKTIVLNGEVGDYVGE